MKVKNIIIEQLVKFNVKHIYGYAGDTTLRFFSALQDSDIDLYTTHHESAAGLMASAEGKLTGNLAVCVAHSGPGTANIINGIADAASDRVPLLLISGQVPTYNLGTNYKQFVNLQELTNPLTVFSSLITNPESAVDLLYKALTMAITQGGVSQLIVPMDLWEMETNAIPRDYPLHLMQKQLPVQPVIDKAGQEINKADKPAILYGRGAKECYNQVIELADKINAPLINTLPAAGLMVFDNPNSLGGLGQAGNRETTEILKEADLIIVIGATWWPVDYTPRKPKVIQLDAVKGNIGLTHPVDYAITGELDIAMDKLLPQIQPKNNQEWVKRKNKARLSWFIRLRENTNIADWPLPPQVVIKTISENTQPDEIICLDSGDNVVWFGKYFGNRCQDILVSGTWRTMGFALPASLSVNINQPQNPVTCIIGDGGLGMVLAELLTAVRYNLTVRIIIINNGSLAMEKNRMNVANLNQVEVDLTNPDFIALASSCGLKGIRVNSIKEFDKVLKETKNIQKSVLIEVPTANYIPPGTKL